MTKNQIVFNQAECAQSTAVAVECDKFWDKVSDLCKVAKNAHAVIVAANDTAVGRGDVTQFPLTQVEAEQVRLVTELTGLVIKHPVEARENLPAIDVQLSFEFNYEPDTKSIEA